MISSLYAHVVFTPKYRRAVFTDAMLRRCEEVMRAVCADFGAEVREFTAEADHVQLLVCYPPRVALSTLVNSLKGVSARRLRREFPAEVQHQLWGHHFWSPSYCVGSAGGAPLAVLRRSIEEQRRPVDTAPVPPGPEGPGFPAQKC